MAASSIPGLIRPSSLFAQDTGAQPKPTDRELKAITEITKQFMDKYRVPGLSLAVARHGQFVLREAFGFSDKNKDEKVTPSHLFRIASVTKPITSVAIFSLIEKGQLHLGDRIFGQNGILQFDYGNDLSELVQKISLEHLLTHTSGGWGNDQNDPMFLDPKIESQQLIASTLKNLPLQNEPGKHFAYSNFGYCLLGRVLEKITGQSYSDFVRQNVLSKCDVQDMQISGNTLLDRAPGEVIYYGQDGDNPYKSNIRRMDSHGGWIATPSDLVQFAMHVDGFPEIPDILKKWTIETMTTASDVNPLYAKGWFVTPQPNWWHSGLLPGSATIMVRTATGLCWAALTNTRTQGIIGALDDMMWAIVRAVPIWEA